MRKLFTELQINVCNHEREKERVRELDIDPFYLDYTCVVESPLSALETRFSRVLVRTETVKIELCI